MTSSAITQKLRVAACGFWSLGLGVMGFDFLSLPVLSTKASLSYVIFSIAALFTAWAEKREFGTRVALYRFHDVVIYSPWKFLLLYFLWISVFAPFTSNPVASMLYAANGWLSLLAIALNAQFIFSERAATGIVLLPNRLRWAFRSYCFSVSLLLANYLAHTVFPGSTLPMFVNEQANLFLYFSVGLPFLLWDLLKEGRRMVPRWLSFITILMGAVATLLVNRQFYIVSITMSVGAIFGLFIYKRIRPAKAFLLGSLILGWGVAMAFALLLWIERIGLRHLLDRERLEMAERMQSTFTKALAALWESRGLGSGVGLTNFTGVWSRVLVEAGVVGFCLYLAFFLNILLELYRVRHSPRVVVSNVSFISVGVFLVLLSLHVENPYGAYVWVWYAIWALFAATSKKKRLS